MTHLIGPRVILGMGAGTFTTEFEAIGLGDVSRPELVESNARILRRVWTENDVSYSDAHYSFSNVTIDPKPLGGPVPFWYCGNTPASARRAVGYADGWMPGRISLATMQSRIEKISELAEKASRPRPTIAVVPPTSVEEDHDRAFSYVNIEGLLAWANKAKYWVKPPSGRFETIEDLAGTLIAGTPEDVVRECSRFEEIGTEHLVFDFRFKFDRWFEQIELLGKEVLPKLR